MSLSTLFFVGTCWGFYRLGQFNERYPGVMNERVKFAWERICEWLKKAE